MDDQLLLMYRRNTVLTALTDQRPPYTGLLSTDETREIESPQEEYIIYN